jgi:hypothetical protein
MVPQNSHGQPPRSFSPEVEEQLLLALGAVTSGKQSEPGPDLLRAVEAAGREAKERELHPEELILAFKQLEKQLDFAPADDQLRASLRTRLIRALLESYYSGR